MSDFTDKQHKSLEETKEFYYDKYPVVRAPHTLAASSWGCEC